MLRTVSAPLRHVSAADFLSSTALGHVTVEALRKYEVVDFLAVSRGFIS